MIANKYTILSKIGSGQFSNVFKGKFNKTDELVAIKTENIETPIPLLKHETRILNYINSKQSYQIPFIYWYGIYEGSPTLIMPFYEMSLEELYKNKGVSKKQHFTNIVKIIEILSFIHECGVIHCDVKPENFMIKDEKIYLIDFGVSALVDGLEDGDEMNITSEIKQLVTEWINNNDEQIKEKIIEEYER